MARQKHTGRLVNLYETPAGNQQIFMTVSAQGPAELGETVTEAYQAVADRLNAEGLAIVHERTFGSVAAAETIGATRREVLSAAGVDPDTPVTHIQGRPLWGQGLAGISLLAVAKDSAWTVRDDAGRPRGRGWQRDGAKFVCLQNLHGREDGQDESREAQADRMFLRAEQLLRGQQLDYRDVARTWLYLSGILEWYGEFNAVRNARYGKLGLMPSEGAGNGQAILLPASTGIEGDAPSEAAVTLDLLAARLPDGGPVELHQMTNRKQKDAFKYGSAFSRGAAIRMPEATWISLSGTAAIDEAGVSLYVGDFEAQMRETLDTVEALIGQEGATLGDLCDTTIFLKRASDAETYRKVAEQRGLADLPGVVVEADVCRDDLLFEMDGAAVVDKG